MAIHVKVVPIRWKKHIWTQSQDPQKAKTTWIKMRGPTQREKFDINFQAKRAFPDERLNTCAGTATDTHRQVYGSLPTLHMNSVTSLPCSTLLLCSILLLPFPQSRGPQPSAVRANISSAYPPLSHSILGMAVEILAQSTQTASSLPRRAGGTLQTTV